MSSSPAARWGLVVFALGIGLLLVVFLLSYSLFASIARQLIAAQNLPAASLPPLSRILVIGAIRLGVLFAMGYVSSLIAAKGLALYNSSRETDSE